MNNNIVALLSVLSVSSLAAILLFLDGSRRWRRFRLLSEIPSVSIQSIAGGLIELRGVAKPYLHLLKSPLTNTECLYYSYLIERREGNKDNGHWAELTGGESTNLFTFRDGTGKVLVSPSGVKLSLAQQNYTFTTAMPYSYVDIPAKLVDYLDSHHIQYKSVAVNYQMRFTEWIICPDAYLYVLGTAITYELFASNRKARMTMLLRELKSSPEQMKSLDTNKDGILSMPEWDKGVNALQQKVMQEEIANGGVAEQGISFVVQKGPSGSKFTFLDKSKNEFANSLLLQAQGEVLLGSIMLVAAIVLLCV